MHGRAERYLRGERVRTLKGLKGALRPHGGHNEQIFKDRLRKYSRYPLSGPEEAHGFARMKEHYTSLISRILNVPNR